MRWQILLMLLLFAAPAFAANDPGHDSLYVLRIGDTNVTGSINITGNVTASLVQATGRFFGPNIDIRGDGSSSSAANQLIGTSTTLELSTSGDLILNKAQTGGMVFVGWAGTTTNLNVSGDLIMGLTTRLDSSGVGTFADGTTVDGSEVCTASNGICASGDGSGAAGGWNDTGTQVQLITGTDDLNVSDTLFVDSDVHRVGIGTSTPDNKLDIENSDGSSVVIDIQNSDTGYNNGDGLQIGLFGSETANIVNYESTSMNLATSGLNRITIEADGDVGIATTTPGRRLTINGATDSFLSWESGEVEKFIAGFDSSRNSWVLYNSISGSYIVSVNGSTGNVGINTTTPSTTLDVLGTINASNVTISGETVCTASNGLCTTAATSPGGSDTQIQFNDGGSFGGDANFTYAKGQNQLNVSGMQFFDSGNTRAIEPISKGGNDVFSVRFDGVTVGSLQGSEPGTSSEGWGVINSAGFLQGTFGVSSTSSTVPSVILYQGADALTGIGRPGSGQISMIGASYEIARFGDSNADEALLVTPEASTDIGLTIQGAASQSANLQEWQNSSGSVLAWLNATGSLSSTGTVNASNLTINGETVCTATNGLCDSAADSSVGGGWVNSSGGGNISLAVAGVNISAETLFVDNTNGRIGIGNANPITLVDGSGVIRARSSTITTPASGEGLEMYFDQSAQEAHIASMNRTNSVARNLKIEGQIIVMYSGTTGSTDTLRLTSGKASIGGDSSPEGMLDINAASATDVGLSIQGTTSQSGSLQEWSNSSGGVRSLVTSDGGLAIGGAQTPSSGAHIELIWHSSNRGIIYSYDRSASQYKNLSLAANAVHLNAAGTDRLTVNNDGRTVISLPSASSSLTPSAVLTVRGTDVTSATSGSPQGLDVYQDPPYEMASANNHNVWTRIGAQLNTNYTGTGTGSYTILEISTNETTAASGYRRLVDYKTNGTIVSYHDVDGMFSTIGRLNASNITINDETVCTSSNGLCASVGDSSAGGGWTNSSGGGNISLAVAGVNVSVGSFFVDNTNGRVGIGTTTPNNLVSIYEGSPAGNEVLFNLSTNGGNRFTIDEDGDTTISSSVNANTQFFRIQDSDGNGMFDIETDGSGHAFMEIRDTSGTVGVLIRGGGGNSYILNDNLGIGMNTPGERLYVSGNINATGDICITGGTCLSDAGTGSGDVTGPGSSTDNAIVRFDSTTGKLIQNSGVTINDSGALSGVQSITTSTDEFFIGSGTVAAGGSDAIAIGWNANASGSNSVALGRASIADASSAIAIGPGADSAASSVAIGASASTSFSSVAIGGSVSGTGGESVVIGYQASGGGVVVGYQSTSPSGTAIGKNVNATGSEAIAIGGGAFTNANTALAIGVDSVSTASNTISIGSSANTTGSYSLAIGGSAKSTNSQSIAIGRSSLASQSSAIAIGYNSTADLANSIAFGADSDTTSANQLMVGASQTNLNMFVYGNITTAYTINASNITISGETVCTASNGLCTTAVTSPGGSDTQIQFNDGGSFGGDANFTFNKSLQQLIIPSGSSSVPSLRFVADADSGLRGLTDSMYWVNGGSAYWGFDTVKLFSNFGGAALLTAVPTATTPSVVPNHNDIDTGLGLSSGDKLTVIAGGNTVLTVSDDVGDEALLVKPAASTDIGLTIQGAASQSANLQEWQNSGGSVLSFVNASGSFSTVGVLNASNVTINDETVCTASNGLCAGGDSSAGGGWTNSSGGGNISLAVAGVNVSVGSFFVDNTNGRVGIGTISPTQVLDVIGSINTSGPGNIYYQGNLTGYGADLAENVYAGESLEAGDVVIIDPVLDEGVRKTGIPYDARAAGIISTDPSHLMSAEEGNVPLALAGRVPVKVTSENGQINRGDLLTTSPTPGYAMRCADRSLCSGAIIGKAMEEFKGEQGMIIALVMLG